MTGHIRAGAVALALCAGALLTCTGAALADPIFYGVTSANTLVRFDMGAQTATVVAPLSTTLLEDCDFDASGTLWAVRQGSTGFPPTQISQAYQVNTVTGACLLQGDFGSSASNNSLAFRSSNAAFYTVNASGGTTSGHPVTANLTAGTVASVAGVAHGLTPNRMDALAFAPGGTLYGIHQSTSTPFGGGDYRLISFNLGTGLASIIGTIGPSSQSFASLRLDPSTGVAYTVDGNTGNVYSVNLATAQPTLLFAGGPAALGTRGIGYIPSPGAAALLGLGGVLAARRRRAHRAG